MVAAVEKLLGSLERFGRFVENATLVALLSAMIVLGAGQILLRNGFGIGFIWADELLRIMVLWIAMLGAIAASRDDNHIAIDILSRFLAGRVKIAARLIIDLFTCIVCGLIAWYAFGFVGEAREFGDTVLNGKPAWLVQAILPVSFGLISYRYLVLAARHVMNLVSGRAPA